MSDDRTIPADPVQWLREALAAWRLTWVNATDSGERDDAAWRIHREAQALLDALPTMLQAARAEGWDEGFHEGNAFTPNPYRVAAADGLARETREQGHE